MRAYERDPRSAPRSWAALIDRRSRSDISPLQFAIAGVNAHVDFDLTFALVTTVSHLRTPLSHGTQHDDYQKINAVFAEHMHSLRTHFETRLGRSFDDHFSAVLNKLGDVSVIAFRDIAWFNAVNLYPRRANRHVHRLYHTALDQSTRALSMAILMRTPFSGEGPAPVGRPVASAGRAADESAPADAGTAEVSGPENKAAPPPK